MKCLDPRFSNSLMWRSAIFPISAEMLPAKSPQEGVLSKGQTVWTKEAYEPTGYPASSVAFVDGVGFVSLDSRWLVRADILGTAPKGGLWQSY